MKTAPMSSSRALTASSLSSSNSCGSDSSSSSSSSNDDAVVVGSSEKDGTSIAVVATGGVGDGIGISSSKQDVLKDNNSESSGMLSEPPNDSSSTDFDDCTMSLGDGGGSSNGTCSPKSQYKQVEMLAKRETQRIQICRIIVLMVIMITGIIVASGAFVFLASEEENNYLTGVRVTLQLYFRLLAQSFAR